jgi:hypothetical protein
MRLELIAGLRRVFTDGATFSGLLRYLIDQHPEGRVSPGVVREYLMEAGSGILWERVLVLARLAERLQRRVRELERQLPAPQPTPDGEQR